MHLINIEDDDLVSALADLPLLVEHEATAESIDLIEESH